MVSGPAAELSVVTRSVWSQPTGLTEVGVMRRLVWRQPDMSQDADAAAKVALDGHLLAIQQGHAVPTLTLARFGCGKTGIEIGGDGKRQGHNVRGFDPVAADQGID